jgi:hypothetical protein
MKFEKLEVNEYGYEPEILEGYLRGKSDEEIISKLKYPSLFSNCKEDLIKKGIINYNNDILIPDRIETIDRKGKTYFFYIQTQLTKGYRVLALREEFGRDELSIFAPDIETLRKKLEWYMNGDYVDIKQDYNGWAIHIWKEKGFRDSIIKAKAYKGDKFVESQDSYFGSTIYSKRTLLSNEYNLKRKIDNYEEHNPWD